MHAHTHICKCVPTPTHPISNTPSLVSKCKVCDTTFSYTMVIPLFTTMAIISFTFCLHVFLHIYIVFGHLSVTMDCVFCHLSPVYGHLLVHDNYCNNYREFVECFQQLLFVN